MIVMLDIDARYDAHHSAMLLTMPYAETSRCRVLRRKDQAIDAIRQIRKFDLCTR